MVIRNVDLFRPWREDNRRHSIPSEENIDFLFHYSIESLGLNERSIAKEDHEPLMALLVEKG